MNASSRYSYICDVCEEQYRDITAAMLCCAKTPAHVEVFICSICFNEYGYEGDAEKCCSDSICVCTHARSFHRETGECGVLINSFVGMCPCKSYVVADYL